MPAPKRLPRSLRLPPGDRPAPKLAKFLALVVVGREVARFAVLRIPKMDPPEPVQEVEAGHRIHRAGPEVVRTARADHTVPAEAFRRVPAEAVVRTDPAAHMDLVVRRLGRRVVHTETAAHRDSIADRTAPTHLH